MVDRNINVYKYTSLYHLDIKNINVYGSANPMFNSKRSHKQSNGRRNKKNR